MNNRNTRHLKIGLLIDMVPPVKETSPRRKASIEERLRDAMCMCESGHESEEDWELLLKVHNILMKKKKLNKKQKRILDMISPFVRKHASASGGKVEIDSQKLED